MNEKDKNEKDGKLLETSCTLHHNKNSKNANYLWRNNTNTTRRMRNDSFGH